MEHERLQKIIAGAGLASRRQAEEWIVQGRVTVNGRVVRELGSKADPATMRIEIDGRRVRPPRNLVYLALYKPRGCVTTRSDPQGRATVMDLLRGIQERVYPVGRLDYHSEGLLLLTNDGQFANQITSATSGVPKTYWVKVSGMPKEEDLDKMRRGILLDGRRTRPARIRLMTAIGRKLSRRAETANPWFEVTLGEGRQNQIRRMFARIGHPVRKLKRVRIGDLTLGKLSPGQFRHLTPAEVQRLLATEGSDE